MSEVKVSSSAASNHKIKVTSNHTKVTDNNGELWTSQIIIDTREQRPYSFPNAIHKVLPAGDYSIVGLENRFAIERKSLSDWINSIIHDRPRFGRELEKLQQYDFALIVIESNLEDILLGDYDSGVTPQALLGMTVAIMHGFHPIHVLLAGQRHHAYCVVKQILKMAYQKWGKEI